MNPKINIKNYKTKSFIFLQYKNIYLFTCFSIFLIKYLNTFFLIIFINFDRYYSNLIFDKIINKLT